MALNFAQGISVALQVARGGAIERVGFGKVLYVVDRMWSLNVIFSLLGVVFWVE
jgi:hypothetical protein